MEELRNNIRDFLDGLGKWKDKIPDIEFNGAEQVVDIVQDLVK